MADIIGLDGKRAEKAKEAPEPRWFEFVLRPYDNSMEPQAIREFGFLIVSPAFLGVVDEADKATLMIPAENILYVRASDEETEE